MLNVFGIILEIIDGLVMAIYTKIKNIDIYTGDSIKIFNFFNKRN